MLGFCYGIQVKTDDAALSGHILHSGAKFCLGLQNYLSEMVVFCVLVVCAWFVLWELKTELTNQARADTF